MMTNVMAGIEDIRVRAGHHVRHHGPGRAAHDIHPRGVALVLVKGVFDHADDSASIATAVVRQTLRILDIPTLR